MELDIDSFAMRTPESDGRIAPKELQDRIVFADQIGLVCFGIGEHYREGFLDSAPAPILAAAAARTEHIHSPAPSLS